MTSDRVTALPSPRTLGLVLAAGFSQRFGQGDKRIAPLPDGTTLLQRTLLQLQHTFTDPTGQCDLAVVIRPEDDPAALGIPDACTVLRAPNAALGLGSSIADAISTVELSTDWATFDSAAILLGDMPALHSDTLSNLLKYNDRNRIVRPRYNGQQGHPVLFGKAFWTELSALTGDEGARRVIAAHRESLVIVEVEDSGVLLDIDTPEQMARDALTR